MKGLPFVLLFTAMTFVAWGAYGPVLHHGAMALEHDSMRAFVGVGLAYFMIAVIIPILILRSGGEVGRWTITGAIYSLIAGAVGAIGALGIILALGYGGQTVYVMPLVFGFAPVVNTLVTAMLSRTFNQIRPIFVIGIVTAALGAGGVLFFKPTPKPVAKPAATSPKLMEFLDRGGEGVERDFTPHPAEQDPPETEPAESEPAESVPAESVPAESVPAESVPSESEPADIAPDSTDTQSTETGTTETGTTETGTTETGTTETEATPAEVADPQPQEPGSPTAATTEPRSSDPERYAMRRIALAAPVAAAIAADESTAAIPPAAIVPPAGARAVNVWGVVVSIIVAALCWGSYGPMLHIGQAKMSGSRLRPFTCVGLAYFFIAVAAPLAVIYTRTADTGAWTAGGMTWSFLAGVAGAIGALGVILAFNAGGKPYYVMPLIFGFAPVINTFISLSEAGTWSEVKIGFWISLAVVITGAVIVLTNAPRPKPHAAK